MDDSLRECVANFGQAPRRFSLWDRFVYLRAPKPAWLAHRPSDKMIITFKYAPRLFVEGVVTWGHVIQANNLIFQNGPLNVGGEVVYSLDDAQRATPDLLARVAAKLFALKGTTPDDPALAGIANYLTDEKIRVYGLRVPESISPTVRCQISTTFFFRKHLPKRRLCTSLLPIVASPREPFVVLPLPKKYWPQDFIEWWSG